MELLQWTLKENQCVEVCSTILEDVQNKSIELIMSIIRSL